MSVLYGDGVRDDAPAIQSLLDSGVCEVRLPAPQKNYLIHETLKIHSNQIQLAHQDKYADDLVFFQM